MTSYVKWFVWEYSQCGKGKEVNGLARGGGGGGGGWGVGGGGIRVRVGKAGYVSLGGSSWCQNRYKVLKC